MSNRHFDSGSGSRGRNDTPLVGNKTATKTLTSAAVGRLFQKRGREGGWMGGELRQAAPSRVKFYELNFSPFLSLSSFSFDFGRFGVSLLCTLRPTVRPSVRCPTNVRRRQKTNKSRNSCERSREGERRPRTRFRVHMDAQHGK